MSGLISIAVIKMLNFIFAQLFDVDFFIPHNWSSEITYAPPKLKSLEDLKSVLKKNNILHIMDHIWLYKEQDIEKLGKFLAEHKVKLNAIRHIK